MGESVFPINENSIGLVAMALAGRKRPHNKVSPIPLNKRIEKQFFVFDSNFIILILLKNDLYKGNKAIAKDNKKKISLLLLIGSSELSLRIIK